MKCTYCMTEIQHSDDPCPECASQLDLLFEELRERALYDHDRRFDDYYSQQNGDIGDHVLDIDEPF